MKEFRILKEIIKLTEATLKYTENRKLKTEVSRTMVNQL